MILSFDKFERYELPQVTLCNPNSRATEVDGKITITDTVGVLSNPKGMNLKLSFNAPHELSFDYYRHKSSDPIKQSFYDSIYDAVQTDRYIYLTDIGYFVISSVTDSDEDNIDKKSITCKSCEENELATAEGLYLEEGTYYLHTEDDKGLLDLFFPKTAGWTIGYIDPSLLAKPYYVEEREVDNGYNFLYTTIQDMFECIVEPDIIKRTISVYSRVYYAEHHLTDIHIAKYNLLKHKTVEENDEDKYTALNVQGKDESLEIRVVNPTGKNVIYNFEPRYSWMSPTLLQAIEKWQEKCESVEDEYLNLQQGYYTELEELFGEEQNIEVLKGQLKQLEETRDITFTMAAGDEKDQSLNNIKEAIAEKQNEINSATSTYNAHKTAVHTNYEVPIAQINLDCALDVTAVDIDGKPIFTTELLNELMAHIKPTEYVDEYMLVTESMTYSQRFEKAKELMDRAQLQLVKISSGQKTYSIDTRSFLFNKQFKHFSEQLCAGAIIYVETKNDTMEQLHLTGIDINFDEKSTNFTLGNKYDRSDLKALYEDALGKNSKGFNELKYIAGILEDQQKQLDYQRNWVADLRTLTLDNVLTSEDQAIEINNRGLTGRKRQVNEDGSWKTDENGNPLFELEQVKLINNTLVFTEDNWNTASTAVGKIAAGYNPDGSVKYAYGINGQVLIGELILGNNLVLTGTGAGIKIKDSNGNDAFYADEKGSLVLSGTIFANMGKIGGWTIDDTRIIEKNNKLPSGYMMLEWIETDGQSYIDTGYIPNQNSGFEIDFITYNTFSSSASEYGCIFGSRQSSKTKEFQLTTYIDNASGFSNGTLRFGNGECAANLSYNSRIICKLQNQQYIQPDGGAISLSSEEFESSCGLTIGALSQNSGGTCQISQYGKVRIYSFKLYEGERCVRDFVPVQQTDGACGLYDLINGVFYGNSGMGSISKGSVSNWHTTLDSSTGSIISKSIIAKGGTIGGWTIENARLERDNTVFNADGTWKSGYRVGMQNGASAVFYAGCKTAAGGSIASSSASNFYVNNDGYVFCNNIMAIGGSVAGWTIDSYKMYKPSTWGNSGIANYGTGISSTASVDDPAFYAGFGGNKGNPWSHNANVDSGGNIIDGGWQTYTKFYVTNKGHLVAKSAEITGTIKASTIQADCILQNGVAVGTNRYTTFYDYTSAGKGTSWSAADGSYSASISVSSDATKNYTGEIYMMSTGQYGAYTTLRIRGTRGDLTGSWYGNNSIITSSDFNKKHEITTLSNQYSILFDNLHPVTYKYNDGTSGRLHTGFIAQEVDEALCIANIDSKDFAGLVIFDKNTDNEEWGLRYEEFIALNTSEIQKAKSRIIDLENTVAELKTQIQILTAG